MGVFVIELNGHCVAVNSKTRELVDSDPCHPSVLPLTLDNLIDPAVKSMFTKCTSVMSKYNPGDSYQRSRDGPG
jgi:hypothetical protein